MDDSWRFRPSPYPALCPTCSTLHFPFCPPPPTFHLPTPFHRPLPPPPIPIQSLPPDPWSTSPAFQPSCLYELPDAKRMRIEDSSMPPFARRNLSPSGIVADAERRLNLIRDHGQQIGDRGFNATGNFLPDFDTSVRGQHKSSGIDHNFDRPGFVSEQFNGYRNFHENAQPIDRRDYLREVLDTSRSGLHFNEPRSFDRFGTLPQFPRDYTHVDPYLTRDSDSYRHRDDVENVTKYAIHTPPVGVSENHATHPQSYRHGDTTENLENNLFRAHEDYSRDGLAENLDRYAAHAHQSYRQHEPAEIMEKHADYTSRGYIHGDHDLSSENYAARAAQSYRHDETIESAEKYAVSSREERPFYNSKVPADPFATSDYALQGPSQQYYGPGRGEVQMNKDLSGLFPRQPYPRTYEDHMPLASHEQGSSNMFRDVRAPPDNMFESHRQHDEVMHTAIHKYNHELVDSQSAPAVEGTSKQASFLPLPSQPYPPLPPEPFPVEHPEPPPSEFLVVPLLPAEPPMPSPAPAPTPASMPYPSDPYTSSGAHLSFEADCSRELTVHASTGIATEGLSLIHQKPRKQYQKDGGQTFPLKHDFTDDLTVDAIHLFRQPYRASRPDHFVVILRGLPGSGKSYMAKALREIEVENGGSAPRIHAMDDYFMIEVEKVEDNDGSKSSTSSRGRKQTTKKVIEYCYEPEMEEAYRSSMLKAFKKTLDEGSFTFIIVDDRNLRVADFAQFWAIAKRSGYEVYLLEAAYKDPAGCAARNVHGFTLDDISKMAEKWEEAPSLYLQLDAQSLFHGDDLNEQSIKEVDMDTDDGAFDGDDKHQSQDAETPMMPGLKSLDYSCDDVGDRWDTEDEGEEEEVTRVRELHSSKWSKELDEDADNSDDAEKNSNALSGLMQAYSKTEKSVHWGDRIDKSGFSIGAMKKKSISSLVIGPGSGYNIKSNPIKKEEDVVDTSGGSNPNESKRRFHEQLRAERESFKAVFDRRRRHRIGGLLDAEDE